MPLISTSYFVCELDIPNRANTNVEARLIKFIEKYEPLFLQLLFGEALYVDFKAGISIVAPGVIDPKWIALRDYDGLKNAIACYVYLKYMMDQATKTTSMSETIPKVENATPASGAYKLFQRSMEVKSFIQGMHNYLYAEAVVYPGWQSYNRYRLQGKIEDELITNPIF